MATGAQTAVSFRASTLAALADHARETYPAECCGIILRRPGEEEEAVRRIRNIQDELHGRDPARYPRTARIAYYMEPKQLLDAQRALEQGGWSLVAIYHSHPDHEAYFSQEDRDRAMAGEEPLYPATAYFIIPVDANAVGEMKVFRWIKEKKDFLEASIAPRSSRGAGVRGRR